MTNKTFAEADLVMHPVEDEWSFKTLSPFGFTSETPPQQGFVRGYIFKHPDGTIIRYNIGVRMDYWEVEEGKPASGCYWKDLELYLKEHYDG